MSRMPVQMKIKGLMLDPVSDMPIVVLKDEGEDRILPIWVGAFEANAISIQLEKVVPPRPYTHDLLRNVIESLNARVDRVVITDLRDNTFFAVIHMQSGDTRLSIDARPSDAMALALRVDAPILVEEAVLEKSSSGDADPAADQAERLRKWLETVDPEELGRYEM